MLLILFFAARPNLEEISLNTPKSSLIIACRVKLNVRPNVNTLTFVPASLIWESLNCPPSGTSFNSAASESKKRFAGLKSRLLPFPAQVANVDGAVS